MLTRLVVGLLVVDAVLAVVFVAVGALHDRRIRRRSARVDEIRFALASVLLAPIQETSADFARLRRQPRTLLIDALQGLAFDLTGPSRDRLVQVADALGIDAVVRSLASESRWRRRARAGQLLHLLAPDDPTRRQLLRDQHPTVRGYAAEGLGSSDIDAQYQTLLGMLDDEARAVRVAARNALLRSDGRSIGQLVAYLDGPPGPGLVGAVEVASQVPDPRLVTALTRHASSNDVPVRRAVARGLGGGSPMGSTPHLVGLLDDPTAEVRAEALESLGRLRSVDAASRAARLLSDDSWEVRRNAARALELMGPIGGLLLRQALTDPDPFAQDIARQTLDAASVRARLIGPPSIDVLRPRVGDRPAVDDALGYRDRSAPTRSSVAS